MAEWSDTKVIQAPTPVEVSETVLRGTETLPWRWRPPQPPYPGAPLAARGETAPPTTAKLTLGLYNCYDPKRWHDIMRVTLARVGPVAVAFGCDVATFGFPFEQARARKAKESEPLRTPAAVAEFVAGSTSIGEGGEYFAELAAAGRFKAFPFPATAAAFPAELGRLVATTPSPSNAKADPLDVARELAAGRPQLLLYGLGPRGLPDAVLAAATHHLEITGKGVSMETATALGALPAMVHAHLQHLVPPKAAAPAGAARR